MVPLPPPLRPVAQDELNRTEPELVPELNARAMAWCLANDRPEEAVGYGRAAGETDIVAGLIDALSPPLYYDGRMETAEEWLKWFGDDELVHYPAPRLRSLVACADRPSRRRGALARPGRRGSFEDPALGRQRHDRALGRHAAGTHDGERRRAGARGRRSGTRSTPTGQFLGFHRTPRPRSCARPARGNRSCGGGSVRYRRARARDWQRRRGLSGKRHNSRSSRRRKEHGPRQGGTPGRRKRSPGSPASTATRRARSCTSRRHASRCTRRGSTMSTWRLTGFTACGRCSTTAFPGPTVESGSSSHVYISPSVRRPPPPTVIARPNVCSS